jgi:hypothetical protein
MKAFAENLEGRRQALLGGGKTEFEAEDELAKILDEKELVDDVREARGLIQGFAMQGVALGGFKTFGDVVNKTPDTFAADVVNNEALTAAGRRRQADSDKALARAERGSLSQERELLMTKAETELTQEGEFDKPKAAEETLRKGIGMISGVDSQQQQINMRALENVRKQARGMGIKTGSYADSAYEGTLLAQTEINAEITDLLKKIADSNEQMARQGRPALVAPPPQPAGRQ